MMMLAEDEDGVPAEARGSGSAMLRWLFSSFSSSSSSSSPTPPASSSSASSSTASSSAAAAASGLGAVCLSWLRRAADSSLNVVQALFLGTVVLMLLAPTLFMRREALWALFALSMMMCVLGMRRLWLRHHAIWPGGLGDRDRGLRAQQRLLARRAIAAALRGHGLSPAHMRLMATAGDRDFSPDDYEALLQLDDEAGGGGGDVPLRQATEAEIRRLPERVLTAAEVGRLSPQPGVSGDRDVEMAETKSGETGTAAPSDRRRCTICLAPFAVGETVRTLPCLHTFHSDCVDTWLRQNALCPVCKFDAV